MKKIIKYMCFVLLVLTLLVSCQNEVTQPLNNSYNEQTDTFLQLNTPSVKAKSWPGYNLVSWQPVQNNRGYEIYRYESDNHPDNPIIKQIPGSSCYYEDFDIQNGVTYKYEIIALGIVGGRGIETTDSKVGTATCVGILPPLNTEPLNLAAYEDGYNGEVKTISTAEQKNYLAGDKIETYVESGITLETLGRYAVRFQAKSYLDYSILITKGNYHTITELYNAGEVFGNKVSTIANNSLITITNVDETTRMSITTSGEYTLWIKVSAKQPIFIKDSFVQCTTKVIIPELVTKETPAFSTINWEGSNKVKIIVKSLTFENGNKIPKYYYYIYKSEKGKNQYSLVTEGYNLTTEDTTYSYIEQCLYDAKTYEYMLVITDGTNYCKTVATKEL